MFNSILQKKFRLCNVYIARGSVMAKSQLKPKESRLTLRKLLSGLLPGKMTANGQALSARPVDISKHGIGILVAQQFEIGTKIELDMKTHTINFKVVWMKPDFGKHDLWRYGLMCSDALVDIEELFAKHGCLK